MRRILVACLLLLTMMQLGFAQGEESSKPEISGKWLCESFGAYNSPLPLKIKINGDISNVEKLKIRAGMFNYSFEVTTEQKTCWIAYPRGVDKISCELIAKTGELLTSSEISVPAREIRDADQRLSAIISNNELSYNERFANFGLKESEIPDNWFNLSALDEVYVVDYRGLNTGQMKALKEYVEAGGVLIFLENFVEADNFIKMMNFGKLDFEKRNGLAKLGSQNHIFLQSVAEHGLGMLIKYKISDNLSFSDELEVVRKNLIETRLPWSLNFVRKAAEYTKIEDTQFFASTLNTKTNNLILAITFAIFLTLLILLIGLRLFKKLSQKSRMIYVSFFCLLLTIMIFIMQNFNLLGMSSFKVSFTSSNSSNSFNLNSEIKLLTFNSAGLYDFPKLSSNLKILSADSVHMNENVEIYFSEDSFSVKTKKRTSLHIAVVNLDKTSKNLTLTESDNQIIASNLSENVMRDLVYLNDFKGTAPTELQKFSNSTITKAELPYRDIFTNTESSSDVESGMFTEVGKNLVRLNREFVACYKTTRGKNLQIIVCPLINQK